MAMINEMLKKENWEKRRIEVTLRVLGRVDSLLTGIRERAGKRLDDLERTRARLDDRRKALEEVSSDPTRPPPPADRDQRAEAAGQAV